MLTSTQVADYMFSYVTRLRLEYQRLTTPPPHGSGYPDISLSSYFVARELVCIVSEDGVIVADYSDKDPTVNLKQNASNFYLVEPPPDTARKMPVVYANRPPFALLPQHCRLLVFDTLPTHILEGILPEFGDKRTESIPPKTQIRVRSVKESTQEVLSRLTFGAFGRILDIYPPRGWGPAWCNRRINNVRIYNQSRDKCRYFRHLEIIGQVDGAAWDSRATWARSYIDARREAYRAFALADTSFGSIEFEWDEGPNQPINDQLAAFADALDEFENLLETRSKDHESVFQSFLEARPFLLDLHGHAEPRPIWTVPSGSKIEKARLIPDFVIKRGSGRYTLVEIEKPSHQIHTRDGRPTAHVAQPAYQISEWIDFIAQHPEQVRDRYPGIVSAENRRTMVVIGLKERARIYI